MLDTRIVGALACQKDSYLQTLNATVVSCVKAPPRKEQPGKGKSKPVAADTKELWEIEFDDSVLFPEGGGQPTDHGKIQSDGKDVEISRVERHGLRCIVSSPAPLEPGTSVTQTVDFPRRWDHMQQHTGQHLLSAIMDTYPNLETLGWGMGVGDSPNYVDLPRKPSEEEIAKIQERCNEVVRENLPITVEVQGEGVDLGKMPEDYDTEKGVVRVIKIADIDSNPCCGTHLRQTSHIALILLLGTQSVHGGQCRLSFICGDRALRLASTSISSIRTIASNISSQPTPAETVTGVLKLKDAASDAKKKATKLLQEIAKISADRVGEMLSKGTRCALVHRATDGTEYLPMVQKELKATIEKFPEAAVVLASGESKSSGQIIITSKNDALVKELAAKIQEAGIDVRGGGRPGQWQGKVGEWKKGEVEKMEKVVGE